MALTPFIGEIVMYSFNFAPKGWAQCNGQLLPINQNQALFSILGTTFGGNGTTNFGLPEMRSRIPIHVGNGHALGEQGGQEAHTLIVSEMPTHNHILQGNNTFGIAGVPGITPANTKAVSQALVSLQAGATTSATIYGTGAPNRTMPAGLSNTGGSQPHENRQPYSCVDFCVALVGVFPSRN